MTVEREKLDELYEVIADMAVHMLEQAGEFFPIGSAVRPDGEVAHAAIHDGNEHPEAQQVIAGLQQLFRKQASDGDILVSAIAIDIRVRKSAEDAPVDAICVQLRAPEFCRDVILPYTIKSSGLLRKTRTVTTGEAWAKAAEQDIFV